MKRLCFLIVLASLALFYACKTAPEPEAAAEIPAERPPERPVAIPDKAPPEEPSGDDGDFDADSITQEVFDTTLADVQRLIGELDGIIRRKNYRGWITYTGDAYLSMISSVDFLKQASESDVLKKGNIRLRSAQDYFNWVVVPSHSKDKVDTIEFVSEKRVKVLMQNDKGQWLRIWDLEKVGDVWKIVS
jgi:hypothetical protein